MKCRFILVVVMLLIAGNLNAETLDSNRWYDCINRNECLKKENPFSDLLAEYLRGDLSLELSKLSVAGLSGDRQNLFKALGNIVFEDLDVAGGYLEMIGDRNSISGRVVAAMISKDRNEIMELAGVAPFLDLQLARELYNEGRFTFAKKILDKLVKNFRNYDEVVILWAGASIKLGDFSSKIISRLKRLRKRDRFNLEVAAMMVRYMSAKGDLKGIQNLKREVCLDGSFGKSAYLLELARVKYKSGDLLEAEAFLRRALNEDSKNAESYLLLGKIYYSRCLKNVKVSYLNECQEMPKAIASLKNYAALTKNIAEADNLNGLLAKKSVSTKSRAECFLGMVLE